MMRVGSLFSGIGGMDLGFETAGGYEIAWQVEKDAWCRRVLAKHWPDVPRYEDVTTLTGEELAPVDLVCGGFPCQPVSHAGQQKGTDDDRWLWPHFTRLLGVLRPRYALVENVPGLFTANDGRAFGEVVGDLAALGYDCEWHVISAADVGAPHLRKRVWIVAHATGIGCNPTAHPRGTLSPSSEKESRKPESQRVTQASNHRHSGTTTGCTNMADAQGERTWNVGENVRKGYFQVNTFDDASGSVGGFDQSRNRESVADTDRTRLEGRELLPQRAGQRPARAGGMADADRATGRPARATSEEVLRPEPIKRSRRRSGSGTTRHGVNPRPILAGPIGIEWEPEPDVGRVAHGIPKRVDRLRGLGNAVVPQVVAYLAVSITAHAQEQYQKDTKHEH